MFIKLGLRFRGPIRLLANNTAFEGPPIYQSNCMFISGYTIIPITMHFLKEAAKYPKEKNKNHTVVVRFLLVFKWLVIVTRFFYGLFFNPINTAGGGGKCKTTSTPQNSETASAMSLKLGHFSQIAITSICEFHKLETDLSLLSW